MGEASGHRQEVLDHDQQIRFTPDMLREMMTDIVGSVLDRASPLRSCAASKSPVDEGDVSGRAWAIVSDQHWNTK
jgi:hypothetical protein